jgi:enoyl-[acyl-carrier protein] reductase I
VADGADAPGLLTGRCGIVVAASSEDSIGWQCARRLRALGARVAIAHRPERSTVASALAESAGAEVALCLDVDHGAAVAGAFEALAARWGRLDFLVHTVMRVPAPVLARPLLELRREDFRGVVETAAYSLVLLCREAMPLFARSTSPRVVALGSACSARFTPHYHVAGIGKAALESTLVYLAGELGPAGVLCNLVSPSLLATDGAVRTVGREIALSTRAHLTRKSLTRKPVDYDDVSDCVAFLCSAHCRNITGEVFTIDGGFSKSYV